MGVRDLRFPSVRLLANCRVKDTTNEMVNIV